MKSIITTVNMWIINAPALLLCVGLAVWALPVLLYAHGGHEHESSLLTFAGTMLESSQGSAIFLIMLVGVLVGALHALEGGHSKTILAALVVDNRVNVRQGLWYVAVFVLAHLSDIFLLGLALMFFADTQFLQDSLADIQIFSALAMLAIAVWILLRELSRFLISMRSRAQVSHDHDHGHHHHHHDTDGDESVRAKLVLAFLEGLAPCPTGWALLFLVIASGKFWLIVPLVGAFALGIALVLVCMLLVLLRFRELVQQKISWFSKCAPLLSALLLVTVSVLLLSSLW